MFNFPVLCGFRNLQQVIDGRSVSHLMMHGQTLAIPRDMTLWSVRLIPDFESIVYMKEIEWRLTWIDQQIGCIRVLDWMPILKMGEVSGLMLYTKMTHDLRIELANKGDTVIMFDTDVFILGHK